MSVKYPPYKHGVLPSASMDHVKKPGTAACPRKPSAGDGEPGGGLGLADQSGSSRFCGRRCLTKQGREQLRNPLPTSHRCICTHTHIRATLCSIRGANPCAGKAWKCHGWGAGGELHLSATALMLPVILNNFPKPPNLPIFSSDGKGAEWTNVIGNVQIVLQGSN